MSARDKTKFVREIEKQATQLANELGLKMIVESDERGKFSCITFRVNTPEMKIRRVKAKARG